jgi:hypothetical protein
MKHTTHTRIVGTVFTIAALTGCTTPSPTNTPTPTPTTSTFTDGTTSTSRSTSPDGLNDGPDAPTPNTADETSQQAAVRVAEKFMTAFARPDLDPHSWINGLYPYLTQQGATAYEDTDPSNVPTHTITGPGTVVEDPTDYALLVKIPTDIGVYVVSLTRKTATDAWLVNRITPPDK